MIRKTNHSIIIKCDAPDCENQEEILIPDMIAFKEEMREEGWHLRKHNKCICMDCWDMGKR
jgi:hypothetical protein